MNTAMHASVCARMSGQASVVRSGVVSARPALCSRSQHGRVSSATFAAHRSVSLRAATTDFSEASSSEPDPWAEQVRSPEETKAERDELKHRLLALAASTNRGQNVDFAASVDAEDMIIQLEGLNPTPKPASAVDGKWTLVYSNVEVFRASPFFWAFQAGVGSEELAASVFRFTAGLPVAGTKGPFGLVSHTIQLPPGADDGRIISEVAMNLFDPFLGILPGPSGTVETQARIMLDSEDGEVMRVAVENTRVTGSNVPLPGGDTVVPVEQLLSTLRGGILEVTARTKFVDETMRITRTGERENQIFVFSRSG